ncbi:unnamed protein product [Withania somnifera]
MIAMNAALEDVYKKVFADSYQHGTDSEKEEAWHEIGGGEISDSELLDSMDGGRALQLKHEINVEIVGHQKRVVTQDKHAARLLAGRIEVIFRSTVHPVKCKKHSRITQRTLLSNFLVPRMEWIVSANEMNAEPVPNASTIRKFSRRE